MLLVYVPRWKRTVVKDPSHIYGAREEFSFEQWVLEKKCPGTIKSPGAEVEEILSNLKRTYKAVKVREVEDNPVRLKLFGPKAVVPKKA